MNGTATGIFSPFLQRNYEQVIQFLHISMTLNPICPNIIVITIFLLYGNREEKCLYEH